MSAQKRVLGASYSRYQLCYDCLYVAADEDGDTPRVDGDDDDVDDDDDDDDNDDDDDEGASSIST